MNNAQRESILEICKQIKSTDLEAVALIKYPEQSAWKTTMIGDLSVFEMIRLTKRLVDQFISEFSDDEYALYPYDYTHPVYGGNNVHAHISSIQQHLSSQSTFDHWFSSIHWLVGYQMTFGFWNKSKLKVHDVKAIELKDKEIELNALNAQYKSGLTEVAELKKQLDAGKIELVNLLKSKTDELNEIKNGFAEAQKNVGDINTKWQNSVEFEGKIKTIYDSSSNLLTETGRQKEEQAKTFDELKKSIDELQSVTTEVNTEIKKTLDDYKQKLESIKNERKYIDDKKKEIENLTGFAADSSLGHSFLKRTTALTNATNIWLAVFVILVAGSGYWLYISFTDLKVNTGNVWADFFMNALKTIPAFVVLGFAAKQYSRERSLQEEYAFKQAVAVTVNAYADQLQQDVNADRKELIKDTVGKIYTPPKIEKDSSWPTMSFRNKEHKEIINKLIEVLNKNKPGG